MSLEIRDHALGGLFVTDFAATVSAHFRSRREVLDFSVDHEGDAFWRRHCPTAYAPIADQPSWLDLQWRRPSCRAAMRISYLRRCLPSRARAPRWPLDLAC